MKRRVSKTQSRVKELLKIPSGTQPFRVTVVNSAQQERNKRRCLKRGQFLDVQLPLRRGIVKMHSKKSGRLGSCGKF